MNLPIERWLQFVLIVSGTALSWRAAFDLNMWLFSDAALTDRAHWVFLPAALRIMAVLILRTPGALGLMLGAYLTLPHANPDDVTYEILLAVSSGAAPLVAVLACQSLFTIREDLAGLNGWHIIALSIACAAANALILNSLQSAMGRQVPDVEAIAAVFAGDVLGAAIVLTAITLSLSGLLALLRRARQGRPD